MRSHPPFITATYIKVCSDFAAELDGLALRCRGAAAPMQGSEYRLLVRSADLPEAAHG